MEETGLITSFITWILGHFGLCMFLLAIAFIIFHRAIRKMLPDAEIVFRWIALFPLGLTGIYTFILHVFFSDVSAKAIGWSASPFQFEVGMADLAIGVLGMLAFSASYGFRVATTIAATIFLWGDAIGHIYQMLKFQNFAPGNAGSWFWMDIIIPLILIFCIINLKPRNLFAR